MWSRLCSERRAPLHRRVASAGGARRACLWPGCVLLLVAAGCASGPRPGPSAVAEGAGAASPAVPAAARTRYEQAVAAMAEGDATEAELLLETFVLEYPDYPGAHVNLAILYAAKQDDAAVEAALIRALELAPGHAAALNQLGMLRRRQGRFEDAEAAYLKAVTADPEYPLAHYNLGVLYELYLQQLDAALQHFERYQELSGEDEQVAKWIVDLKRRVAANQRTANVSGQ